MPFLILFYFLIWTRYSTHEWFVIWPSRLLWRQTRIKSDSVSLFPGNHLERYHCLNITQDLNFLFLFIKYLSQRCYLNKFIVLKEDNMVFTLCLQMQYYFKSIQPLCLCFVWPLLTSLSSTSIHSIKSWSSKPFKLLMLFPHKLIVCKIKYIHQYLLLSCNQ